MLKQFLNIGRRCISTNVNATDSDFHSLGLPTKIISNLADKFNIQNPSSNQKSLLPMYLSKQNVIVRDSTGTGKSFGFVLAMVAREYKNPLGVHGIFVVPNRELALQVHSWIQKLDDLTTSHCVITGQDVEAQANLLASDIPKFLIGTPNRIVKLIEEEIINPDSLEMLAIDELDRIFILNTRKVNYLEKLIKFAKQSPLDVQILAGSASLEVGVVSRYTELVADAKVVDFQSTDQIPKTISHIAYFAKDRKFLPLSEVFPSTELALVDDDDLILDHLVKLMAEHGKTKAFVFVSSNISLNSLVTKLCRRGLKADKLINLQDYDSSTGSRPFERFNDGSVDVICASEYESRGLDVPDIDMVFILGPMSPKAYLHCCGRVGRFGKAGTAISLFGGERYWTQYVTMLSSLGLNIQ